MLVAVHESGELVFIEVEDSTRHALHATHGPHTVNCLRWPVAPQDVVDVAHTDAAALVAGKLDRDHSLLSSDQTASSESSLVVA